MKKTTMASLLFTAFVVSNLAACTTPAKLEIVPDKIVLEDAGAKQKLSVKVLDESGKEIPGDHDIVWFCETEKIVTLTPENELIAVASGEAEVEAELVGTELKTTVPVRVKIASAVQVSHERLRLWTGQVKEDVSAHVRSEKDAFIEGYYPTWSSEDPNVVKVETKKDPSRRYSFVRMTGMKSGTTYIKASFKGIAKTIRVAVYDEDEEVAADGTRIPKDAKKDDEEEK